MRRRSIIINEVESDDDEEEEDEGVRSQCGSVVLAASRLEQDSSDVSRVDASAGAGRSNRQCQRTPILTRSSRTSRWRVSAPWHECREAQHGDDMRRHSSSHAVRSTCPRMGLSCGAPGRLSRHSSVSRIMNAEAPRPQPQPRRGGLFPKSPASAGVPYSRIPALAWRAA